MIQASFKPMLSACESKLLFDDEDLGLQPRLLIPELLNLHQFVMEKYYELQPRIRSSIPFHQNYCQLAILAKQELDFVYKMEDGHGREVDLKYFSQLDTTCSLRNSNIFIDMLLENNNIREQVQLFTMNESKKDARNPDYYATFALFQLAQTFHTFQKHGLFPDPIISNIVLRYDKKTGQPMLIFVPTFQIFSFYLKQSGLRTDSTQQEFVKLSYFYKNIHDKQMPQFFERVCHIIKRESNQNVIKTILLNCYQSNAPANPFKSDRTDFVKLHQADEPYVDRFRNQLIQYMFPNHPEPQLNNLPYYLQLMRTSSEEPIYSIKNLIDYDIVPSLYDHARPLILLEKLLRFEREDFINLMKDFQDIDHKNYEIEQALKQKSQASFVDMGQFTSNIVMENFNITDKRFHIMKYICAFICFLLNGAGPKFGRVALKTNSQTDITILTPFQQQLASLKNQDAEIKEIIQTKDQVYPESYIRTTKAEATFELKQQTILQSKIQVSMDVNLNNLGVCLKTLPSQTKKILYLEYIPTKFCLVAKIFIDDIKMQIDEADDIAKFANVLSDQDPTVNIHFNDQRQLTVAKTLCVCQPVHIYPAIIQMIDHLFLYYVIIYDAYMKKIFPTVVNKHLRYPQAALEMKYYLERYNILFEDLVQAVKDGINGNGVLNQDRRR